jgi:hypothetical protein
MKKTSVWEANTEAVLTCVAAVGNFASVAASVGSAERLQSRKVVLSRGLLHYALPNSQKVLCKCSVNVGVCKRMKCTDTAWDILISVAACFLARFSTFSASWCQDSLSRTSPRRVSSLVEVGASTRFGFWCIAASIIANSAGVSMLRMFVSAILNILWTCNVLWARGASWDCGRTISGAAGSRTTWWVRCWQQICLCFLLMSWCRTVGSSNDESAVKPAPWFRRHTVLLIQSGHAMQGVLHWVLTPRWDNQTEIWKLFWSLQ